MWSHTCNCHDSEEAQEDRAKGETDHLCCCIPLQPAPLLYFSLLASLWCSWPYWNVPQCTSLTHPPLRWHLRQACSSHCNLDLWKGGRQCHPATYLQLMSDLEALSNFKLNYTHFTSQLLLWWKWPEESESKTWLEPTLCNFSIRSWLYQCYPQYDWTAFGAVISMIDASQTTFTFSGESKMRKVKVKIGMNQICVTYH